MTYTDGEVNVKPSSTSVYGASGTLGAKVMFELGLTGRVVLVVLEVGASPGAQYTRRTPSALILQGPLQHSSGAIYGSASRVEVCGKHPGVKL